MDGGLFAIEHIGQNDRLLPYDDPNPGKQISREILCARSSVSDFPVNLPGYARIRTVNVQATWP
jgi:hypothetical protein